MANVVTAQVNQTAADLKTMARAALDNAEEITTLKAKLAAPESKENNQNSANQVTTQVKQTNP